MRGKGNPPTICCLPHATGSREGSASIIQGAATSSERDTSLSLSFGAKLQGMRATKAPSHITLSAPNDSRGARSTKDPPL